MKNVSVAQVRKYLKDVDKEDLEEMIIDFFKENPSIKKQISYDILGDEYGRKIVEDYRKKMKREFDKKSSMFSLRTLNGYLSDLKREVGPDNMLYADLVLYVAENILDFVDSYEYYEERVENAYYKRFQEVIKIVTRNKYAYDYLKDRMRAFMDNKYLNDSGEIDGFIDEYYAIPWLSEEERSKYQY